MPRYVRRAVVAVAALVLVMGCAFVWWSRIEGDFGAPGPLRRFDRRDLDAFAAEFNSLGPAHIPCSTSPVKKYAASVDSVRARVAVEVVVLEPQPIRDDPVVLAGLGKQEHVFPLTEREQAMIIGSPLVATAACDRP